MRLKMENNIRKISIGTDYKNDAMHYAVGQQVYGGHEISHILFNEKDNSYNIYIKKDQKNLMRFCRGRSSTLTWLSQQNMIQSTNEKLI